MIDNVRAWLNGSRDYFTGIAILQQAGGDKDLLTILVKGPNEFRVRRLQEEIMIIYQNLKFYGNNTVRDNGHNLSGAIRTIDERYDKRVFRKQENNKAADRKDQRDQEPDEPNANLELYTACRLEADTEYKRVMNLRAILFSHTNVEDYINVNMPHKIKEREKLAIDVVTGFQKVSELYDQADYVKKNGRLPHTEENSKEEYTALPDYLVKDQLDNARKAYNKLKNKEQTPARIALMQKHDQNIKKLEKQWRSLQPQ